MRTPRHNLKLAGHHRARFLGPSSYDAQLNALLDGLEQFTALPSNSKQLPSLLIPCAAALPKTSTKWTVWVDNTLKERFHLAKAACCPPGTTHGLFTELLLTIRDATAAEPTEKQQLQQIEVAASPLQTPPVATQKQPFAALVSNIAHQIFNGKRSTPSRRSSLVSQPSTPQIFVAPSASGSRITSNLSQSQRTDSSSTLDPLTWTLSGDSSSTASFTSDKSLRGDLDSHKSSTLSSIRSIKEETDAVEDGSAYRREFETNSSISSISIYSDSDISSLPPKHDDFECEKDQDSFKNYYAIDDGKKLLDCKLETLHRPVSQFGQPHQQQLPYHCYYLPNALPNLPPLPFQQEEQQYQLHNQKAPAYCSEFSAPPGYGLLTDAKRATEKEQPIVQDLKIQQEYLWQWYNENGNSHDNLAAFGNGNSFWNYQDQDVVDPAMLVQIQQQHAAHLRKQQHEQAFYGQVHHQSNGSRSHQHQQQQQRQQPGVRLQLENEPLPPYLGIMTPLNTPFTSLESSAKRQPSHQSQPQQSQQQQQLEADDNVPYDMYLNNITDSPNFAPMQVDDDMASSISPLFGGSAANVQFGGVLSAGDMVLPPPAYQNSLDLENDVDMEMELENFVGFY
ncbi:UNVERIFIED_CONTAM: hypothetical protein HDU68_002672 [Siphonaria sp. JEL0065]|nr:hypothetical protein HDU68_002672 [Siphonaria sp. JEL0065]